MAITEAIVLAGGLGTRLRSAVPDLPKCMAPVNGKPFIGYVMAHLQKQGITHIIFSLGYLHDAFEGYLQENLPVNSYTIVVEKEPLGTGGAIAFAMQSARTNRQVVVNGDSIFTSDIIAQSGFHEQRNATCTLALKAMHHFDRYGVVETDSNGRITRFREKQAYEKGLINAGVYIINRESFQQIPFPEKFSFETDYLQRYYPEGTIYGIEQEGYFIDIGIPEDYERAQKELR